MNTSSFELVAVLSLTGKICPVVSGWKETDNWQIIEVKMKLSSFLMAILFLFQGTYWNMDDVTRMGALIEHAKFHSDTYGDNFLEFLSKHYGELQKEHDEKHQEEQSEHENLPFQNHSCVLVLADLASFTNNYSLSNSVISSCTPQNFHYQDNYASLAYFEIFEPPRLT